jgi:hypothetical protein
MFKMKKLYVLLYIKPFEDLLDVNIMVLSSKTGNKLCRLANKPGRRNIYMYMTEHEVFSKLQCVTIKKYIQFFHFQVFERFDIG